MVAVAMTAAVEVVVEVGAAVVEAVVEVVGEVGAAAVVY